MPIGFFSIPIHIRNDIVGKMNLPDFVNFHESSKSSYLDALNVTTRFTLLSEIQGESVSLWIKKVGERRWDVEQEIAFKLNTGIVLDIDDPYEDKTMPFRTGLFNCPVRFEDYVIKLEDVCFDDECLSLIDFITESNSSIKLLYIDTVYVSPEVLDRLLEVSKCREIMFFNLFPSYIMETRALNKMRKIAMNNAEIGDADLEILDIPSLHINYCDISSAGINELLKKMKDGRSSVMECTIRTFEDLESDDVFRGIETEIDILPDGSEIVKMGKNFESIVFYGDKIYIRKSA